MPEIEVFRDLGGIAIAAALAFFMLRYFTEAEKQRTKDMKEMAESFAATIERITDKFSSGIDANTAAMRELRADIRDRFPRT